MYVKPLKKTYRKERYFNSQTAVFYYGKSQLSVTNRGSTGTFMRSKQINYNKLKKNYLISNFSTLIINFQPKFPVRWTLSLPPNGSSNSPKIGTYIILCLVIFFDIILDMKNYTKKMAQIYYQDLIFEMHQSGKSVREITEKINRENIPRSKFKEITLSKSTIQNLITRLKNQRLK